MVENVNEIAVVWEWALKELRRRVDEAGNASEVARQIGIKQAYFDKLLKGSRGSRPTAYLVQTVLNGLGVKMRELAKELDLSEETVRLYEFQDQNREVLRMLSDIETKDPWLYKKILSDILAWHGRVKQK